MNEHNLLPCPFCGNKASFEEIHRSFGFMWSVGCQTEGCFGYQSLEDWNTKKEAAAAWNKRVDNASGLS